MFPPHLSQFFAIISKETNFVEKRFQQNRLKIEFLRKNGSHIIFCISEQEEVTTKMTEKGEETDSNRAPDLKVQRPYGSEQNFERS